MATALTNTSSKTYASWAGLAGYWCRHVPDCFGAGVCESLLPDSRVHGHALPPGGLQYAVHDLECQISMAVPNVQLPHSRHILSESHCRSVTADIAHATMGDGAWENLHDGTIA